MVFEAIIDGIMIFGLYCMLNFPSWKVDIYNALICVIHCRFTWVYIVPVLIITNNYRSIYYIFKSAKYWVVKCVRSFLSRPTDVGLFNSFHLLPTVHSNVRSSIPYFNSFGVDIAIKEKFRLRCRLSIGGSWPLICRVGCRRLRSEPLTYARHIINCEMHHSRFWLSWWH